ncbi:MAG: TIR domain-containing protein [Bacteroidetes bacterium]|nr:TIR domain-containing protein [Bacteroidota bacterium]
MNDVFISYSIKDSSIAFKIYNDLKRSGLKPYLYEKDGEDGKNFKAEIYDILNKVKYFCLIDSPNARKSEWIKLECEYINKLKKLQKRKNIKVAIPCIVHEPGPWFSKDELLTDHREIRWIDFSGLTSLDFLERYKHAINKLCPIFGVSYRPWSDIPRSRDFEKELAAFDLDADTREFLIRDYLNFTYCVNKSSSTTPERIRLLIRDFEATFDKKNKPIKMISSYLAQGQILVDSNNDSEALSLYSKLINDFPDDARSWAALSGAQFYSDQYLEALISIDKAVEIVRAMPENTYNLIHLPELYFNKIQILLMLNKYEEVYSILLELTEDIKRLPEFLVAEIKLAICQEYFPDEKYKYLVRYYYDFKVNSSYLNRIIADMEFYIGRYFNSIKDIIATDVHYTLTCEAVTDNLQYFAELALVKTARGSIEKSSILAKALKIKSNTKNDHYFYGLLQYLNGNLAEAIQYYKISEKEDWPYYDQLIWFE